ncbi:transposase [Streptomyces sp. NPDC127061]|uniref:transposase n=1 Tax=unclassified Streptomyces TaxID=2593676 RepID=UPI00362C6C1D
MGTDKRTYDAEFREGAVRIVIETGKPIPQVAEELGVHPGTLHSWVSRWRRNGSASSGRPAAAESGGRVRESERAELERLRREMGEKNKRIRELEMERDVFKRCMALWVKRPSPIPRHWPRSSVTRGPSTTSRTAWPAGFLGCRSPGSTSGAASP